LSQFSVGFEWAASTQHLCNRNWIDLPISDMSPVCVKSLQCASIDILPIDEHSQAIGHRRMSLSAAVIAVEFRAETDNPASSTLCGLSNGGEE